MRRVLLLYFVVGKSSEMFQLKHAPASVSVSDNIVMTIVSRVITANI